MAAAEAAAGRADRAPVPPWGSGPPRRPAVARETETVGQVLRRLRSEGADDSGAVFVVDERHHLRGALTLAELLATPDAAMLGACARRVAAVPAGTDPEHAAMQALHHGSACVAVVDAWGRLVDAWPPARLLLVLHREHVEDVHKLAGIVHERAQAEHALAEPPLRRARHRLPWLLVGLAGSALATLVTSRFHAALEARVALAYFIPAIVYLADAVGTQTEAVAVRFLSFGSGRRRMAPLLRGEALTGLTVGASLGALSAAGVWLGFGDGRLSLAVGLSVLAAGTVASTIGLLLPWVLWRQGLDPAFGSGPVATVIQDVVSLLLYFAIVTLLVAY